MGQVRKIKAGLVKISVNDFVGEDGNIFFDIDDGVMRLSDGTTPGGVPLSSGGAEGGASTFRELLDTPSSFTGAAGNFVKVNAQGSAIEFVDVDLFDGDYNNLTNKPVIPTAFDPSSIDQSLLPDTDIAYDLGSATKQWRDLYLSGDTIFLGGATIRKREDGGVELPANSKVNGRKIAFDVKDLDDVEGRLNGLGGTTNYNELTNLPTLFSGAYADLTGKPSIPTDVSDLTDNTNLLVAGASSYNDLTDLPVLFSGSYTDLTNKPSIPTDVSDLTDTTNLLVAGASSYNDLTDLPTLVTSYDDLTDTPTLVTSYNDLTDTPTLVTSYNDLTDTPTLFSGSYDNLTDTPTLVTSYNDLTDTPTALSAFTNDSGYITEYTVTESDVTAHQAAISITESQISDLGTYLTSVAFSDLTTTPTTLIGYGITDAYTIAQVDTAITTAVNDLLGDAPELLNTLEEIADAVGDDANFIDTINSAITLKANSADLAAVATTGSYNDLTDTPALFSGAYADLTGVPFIPSNISDLTNDTGFITGIDFASVTLKPTTLLGYGITDAATAAQGALADTALQSYTVTESDVTAHQAALSITESQISDFGTYLTSVAFTDLTTTPTTLSGYGITDAATAAQGALADSALQSVAFDDLTTTPTTLSGYGITDAATAAQGALADTALQSYTVTESDVTAHQAALSITESQISDLQSYLTDYTVTELDVTAHQAALSITESQISDFGTYLTSVAFSDLTTTPTTIAGYGITDAFSGSYIDLTNKPTIPADVSDLTDDSNLLASAFDGAYSSLTGIPTTLAGYGIDTEVSTAISTAVDNVLDGAPALLDTLNEIAAAVGDDPNFVTTINTAINLKANSADLSLVATTNDYEDLTNLPVIPADVAELNDALKSIVPNAEAEIFAMAVMMG